MRKRVQAAVLMFMLVFAGLGAGKADTNAPSLATAEKTPAQEALETAWRSGEADRELFAAEGSGDLIALQDNTLFVIRKKQVGIYHVENGGFYRLNTLDVGFWWLERRDENGWNGCEKTPLELYVSGNRLAVVSAWVEYSEVWSEGERQFYDLSRTVLDIFDISDPANPVCVSSYGQDGSACAGHIDGEGHFWLLSRRSVYEADYALPAVYNSEHRIELESDHVDVHSGGRAQMIVLGLYDLTDGVRWDARALFGGGERSFMGGDGAYIIGTEGGVIHYPFGTERIEKPAAIGMTGSVLDAALLDDILYLATDEGDHTLFTALSANLSPLWEREMLADAVDWGFGEGCFRLAGEDGLQLMNLSDRSLREGKLSAGRAERLDERHWLTLSYNADGSALDLGLLRSGAKGALKEAGGLLLGYDFRPALEEAGGISLVGEHLLLCSETGCSIYGWDNDGFVRRQDVFTADNSAHMRFFLLGDYLYIADTREVHALRLSDLVFAGEWFL